MATRSELREKVMTILYQIELYKKNKIEYNVDNVIRENVEIENEFVKNMVYGVVSHVEELDESRDVDRRISSSVVGHDDRDALFLSGSFFLLWVSSLSFFFFLLRR